MTFPHVHSAFQEGMRAVAGGQTEIDFSAVAAVDSSAVAALIGWQRAAKAAGNPLRFHHLPAGLSSLAGLYGVADMIDAG